LTTDNIKLEGTPLSAYLRQVIFYTKYFA